MSKCAEPKFKIGDKVRINKTKRAFDKGYLPNWTREIFEITHVNKTFSPITYKIKDLQDEQILGTYYEHELQLIKDDEIDSVLDRRTRREGKKIIKEIKVNWKGYPKKFGYQNPTWFRKKCTVKKLQKLKNSKVKKLLKLKISKLKKTF